jgi:hypothetical protein
MAKDEGDFRKLLSEAPMAPDADTVTVVGILARTPDAARFVLTLPDGRSVALDVDAVKSAKAIAGAIGQSVVQLELDAKCIPENLMQSFKSGPDWTVAYIDHPQLGPWGNPGGGSGSPPKERIETHPPGGLGQVSPFVAAMPHQAPPGTIEALIQHPGIQKYPPQDLTLIPYYPWTGDHIYPKVRFDPQTAF